MIAARRLSFASCLEALALTCSAYAQTPKKPLPSPGALAKRMLREEIDQPSKRADEMISGLAPYLANCVHKGQTLRINKAGLRAITALAAYRLAGVNSATGKI